LYAIKQNDNQVNKTAKGIKKNIINEIDFDQYYNTLLHQSKTFHNFYNIRSLKHQLYTIKQTKKGLSSFDDKRYVLNNNINTQAYGNYLNGY
jgi:hypothetical protein